MVVRIFDITDLTMCALWGGMFLVFPTVTSTLFFAFTAVYYGIAILMTVLAVYVTDKYRGGPLLAALLAACSLGTYQAYFPMMICLYVTLLIVKAAEGKHSFAELLKTAFRYLGTLLMGLVAYFVLLKVMLRKYGTELSDYQGINNMGWITFSEIPQMLKRIYKEFLKMPLEDYYGMSATQIVQRMLLLLGILSLVLMGYLIFKKRDQILKKGKGALFLFVLIYPMAVNSIVLMCYHSDIYTMMIYGAVFIYLMPVVFLAAAEKEGKTAPEEKKLTEGKMLGWFRKALIVILSVIILNYIWQSNGNYTVQYYTNQQTYNYWNSLVTQVKMQEGFQTELKWAFVGKVRDPLYQNPWGETPFMYGGNRKSLLNVYSRN